MPRQTAVASVAVRVVGCEQPAGVALTAAALRAVRAYRWGVTKASTSPIALNLPWTSAATIGYEVRFARSLAGLGGFALDAEVEVRNPNYFDLELAAVQLEVSAPGARPEAVRASCPGAGGGQAGFVLAAGAAVKCRVGWAARSGDGGLAVRPQVVYADGRSVDGAPAQLSWADAEVSEAGRCALVSDTFAASSADPLAEPSLLEGNPPPPAGQEKRVCAPAVFRYTATWGPWRRTDCGLTQP
jgi:hypothetical protein